MNYLQKKYYSIMSLVDGIKGFIRTVSGIPPLTLPACVDEESLIDYKLYGNSVQDGTPTPDEPATVEDVGDLTENLFDNKRSWDGAGSTAIPSYGSSNVTKLAGGGYYLKPYSSVLFRFTNLTDGEKYTISWDITTEMSGQNTNPIQINGSILKHNYVYSKETKRLTQSFTATATTTIAFGFVNTSNPAYSASITNIMLVKGETAKAYEPFGYRIPIIAKSENGQSIATNIYLDAPLRKIGDYADYIDFENSKVVRQIKEIILNGTETWSTVGGNAPYIIATEDRESVYDGVLRIKSSHFQTVTNADSWSKYSSMLSVSSARPKYIVFRYTSVSNLNEFKTWLSNNKPSLIYKLLTTKEEEIDLSNLPTFKGTTIYEVGTSVQPSNMEAVYYSTKKG